MTTWRRYIRAPIIRRRRKAPMMLMRALRMWRSYCWLQNRSRHRICRAMVQRPMGRRAATESGLRQKSRRHMQLRERSGSSWESSRWRIKRAALCASYITGISWSCCARRPAGMRFSNGYWSQRVSRCIWLHGQGILRPVKSRICCIFCRF